MLGEVWRWAGEHRRRDTNIGIDRLLISEAVRNLCEDAKRWFGAAAEPHAHDVAAVDFHHRLVFIHPFVNGNGRHARLAADLLARAVGGPPFTWGGGSGAMGTTTGDPVRAAYLSALRAADRGELGALVAFARS
jgi:Fic-DOC domain mobile mystery protein B